MIRLTGYFFFLFGLLLLFEVRLGWTRSGVTDTMSVTSVSITIPPLRAIFAALRASWASNAGVPG